MTKAKLRRPLTTRLRAARALLSQWRRTVYDSEKIRSDGPDRGTVSDAAAHELARFDEAREALSEAIKLAKERVDG